MTRGGRHAVSRLQLDPLERELRPHARADPRVQQLMTIRFASARKLVGYPGLTPTIKQPGKTHAPAGCLGRTRHAVLGGSRSRPASLATHNPWHRLYTDTKRRHGKANPESRVARKVLIAAWHILIFGQPFKPSCAAA